MELKRDGTVKVTELLQESNKQQINKNGTIEFDEFTETAINGQVVNIKRNGEMTAKEFEENTKEIQIMAGLYYNADEELWTFKKDELTPTHNPDIPLYLMIETRGRNGFTVSRGTSGGEIDGDEMFMPIDDVLNGTEESLDVTAMVHRQIERKKFKPGSFKEGNRLGVRYNVNAEGEVSDTPYSEFILADREFRGMYPGTEKSKKTYYTKMRFIIGYFEDNNPYSGRHKKYQWGKKGKDGPDVGCVLQLFYTVDSATPDTIHIDNLNKRININL